MTASIIFFYQGFQNFSEYQVCMEKEFSLWQINTDQINEIFKN